MAFVHSSDNSTYSSLNSSQVSLPSTQIPGPDSPFGDAGLAFFDLLHGTTLKQIQDELVDIAHEAGHMMTAAVPTTSTSETKRNTSDRVTETDKAIETMVHSRLTSKYPDFEFLGEEQFRPGQKLSDKPTFVCDPIDGTLNFIHGLPSTAISLALTVNCKPVVGVVYNPLRQDLYTAIKGQGSFFTPSAFRSPNHPSETFRLPLRNPPAPLHSLNNCLVALEWGSQRSGPNWDLRTSTAIKLMSAKSSNGAMCHSLRSHGSAALDMCYVAAGQIDVFWEGGCWIWDVCAGWLILEEAGGIVASANPGDWEPSLEGRVYLGVRMADKEGQKRIVQEMWGLMEGRRFVF